MVATIFLALRVNSGLKELRIDGIDVINEKVNAVMRRGLGGNSTLDLSNIKVIYRCGGKFFSSSHQ
jgi:hypothetical protein